MDYITFAWLLAITVWAAFVEIRLAQEGDEWQ
jgi:hypothetical protein